MVLGTSANSIVYKAIERVSICFEGIVTKADWAGEHLLQRHSAAAQHYIKWG